MVVLVEQQVFQVIHGLVMKLAASEPEQVVVELEICNMEVGLTVYNLFDFLISVVKVYNQSFLYLMEKISSIVELELGLTGYLEVASGIGKLKMVVVWKEDEHMHHIFVVVDIHLTVSVLIKAI